MGPVPEPGRTFAALLKELRIKAGLTQEELARAATVSYRSISDLERGINLTARSQTARLLADALNLKGATRGRFEAAARGTSPMAAASAGGNVYPLGGQAIGAVAAVTRTLPRDTGAFTGRASELRVLMTAVTGTAKSGRVVNIHAIGGMAGVGKTTLAIHAAHQLAPRFPDGQLFLPLHAHTPGQRPVDPADALASLLLTAGIPPSLIPPGLDERVRLWRDHLAGRRLLLLLDDAAGHDQIQPLLPGTPGNLVLITSRKHLTALDDAQAVSLDTLPPAEATKLLIELANRPDLAADDGPVGELARLCGYLPLAIGMLAKQLHHHPAWTASDLMSELATARDRFELMRAENVSVSAAFDLSYQDLASDQQQLFRRLGLHPGATLDAYAAAALDGADVTDTRRRLRALYDHYMLAEPTRGWYLMHDLVREHARILAAGDTEPERQAATSRLLGYYLSTTCAADRHLARLAPAEPPADLPNPLSAPVLATRDDAIRWMDSERINLNAVIQSATEHGRPDVAMALSAAMHAHLRFGGHWDQAYAQNATALDLARRAGDQRAESAALTNLGDIKLAMRDYRAASADLTKALDLYIGQGDRLREAECRMELASAWYLAGDNRAAADGLTRALDLYREIADHRGEAVVLSRLASVQLVTGDYPGAASSLTRALDVYRELGDRLGEAHALNDLGAVQQAIGQSGLAATWLEQALAIYTELGDHIGLANAMVDLAGVRHSTGDLDSATSGLGAALDLYAKLGDRLGRANVFNLLGAIEQARGRLPTAATTLREALDLYRDLGDRAGEAESLVNIGNVTLEAGAAGEALACFEEARSIADEAASVLTSARAIEGIGQCQLSLGHRTEAVAALTQALEIYHRIGSPDVSRAAQALHAATDPEGLE
jgi:tetratricopeptide (TPR) repeat protein/DNA-binding XRE family transcriptional regulator